VAYIHTCIYTHANVYTLVQTCICVYRYGGRGHRGRLVEEPGDAPMRLGEGREKAAWKRESALSRASSARRVVHHAEGDIS